jgi:hypothetical protein
MAAKSTQQATINTVPQLATNARLQRFCGSAAAAAAMYAS